MKAKPAIMNIQPAKNLSYLLKPASSDCNLFCDYCFYRKTAESYPETSVHRMTLDTYTELVKKAQTYNKQMVGYMWQGGEPMVMGLEFFEEAIRIQNENRAHGQMISNTIQTNGILIDEQWARFFAENQFLVGISIDGPQDLHDIHRFTRAGTSVYDRVMKACRHMEEQKVDFNILAVINNDTVKHPLEIYRYLVEQDFHFLQFIPCVESIDNEMADFSVDSELYGRFLCELFDEWFQHGYPYFSIRLFDNFLQYRVGREPECCMYKDECGGYFVVEHNGDIFTCDFFVMDDWKLGNIHDNTIEDILEMPKYNEFAKLRGRRCDECEDCRWLDFCQRGCVKFRYLPELDYDSQNYLCTAYKMFFEHANDRYDFLAWDIMRRHRGIPPPENVKRNDPCFCGSGKKFKKCCEPYSFILKR
ncbi:Anaerobic sulfatase-maturating enzyme [subsurface metagenome]